MSKYIIELGDSAKKVVAIYLDEGVVWTGVQVVEDLEILNSDYIKEHFSDLQDTVYQRGLEDAWEAARKVAFNADNGGLSIEDLEKAFDCLVPQQVFKKYTAQQTIDKLKAYEEKQKADGEIKVGDEVIYIEHKFIVFATETEEHYASLFDVNGNHASASQSKCKKTGRHFDIDKIMEEMKECSSD